MNPTIQSGTHPDAESLTAFAEHLLPEAEREQVLAHMIACSRCREVVFFAQRMTQEEPVLEARKQAKPEKKASRGWNGWRWAWIPVAAMAGFVGIAVVQHTHEAAPEQQMAKSAAQPEPLKGAMAAKAPAGPTLQQPAERNESTKLPALRESSPRRRERDAEVLDEMKADKQKDEVGQRLDSFIAVPPGVSGGAIHGMVTARAKSSPVGGPIAQNQLEQQNNMAQQNVSQSLQSAGNVQANKPVSAGALTGAAAESVTVQAEQQATLASSAPAPAPQAGVPKSAESYDVSQGKLAKFKAPKVSLPNGLEVLSSATADRRTIAIDTTGALFVSEDVGKHWRAVSTQWTGRAVLVRTRQPRTESALLSRQLIPQFELVNDKLQTWVSADGNTWMAETSPAK